MRRLKYGSLLQQSTTQSATFVRSADFTGTGRSKSIRPLWPMNTAMSYAPVWIARAKSRMHRSIAAPR